MAKYTSESQYVCSIYPGKLDPFVANVGPDPSPRKGRRTVYSLAPIKDRYAKKVTDRYCVVEFADAFESVPNPQASTGGPMPMTSSPVPCQELVKNALSLWCGNIPGMPAGYTPGIGVIANSVPTEAELKELERRQTLYFETWFQLGEKAHRENKWDAITQPMRDACVWLGYTRVWASPERSSEQLPCPMCQQLIRPEQVICHHCRSRVRDLPANLAKLNPELVHA
jgi:hypothetical protein